MATNNWSNAVNNYLNQRQSPGFLSSAEKLRQKLMLDGAYDGQDPYAPGAQQIFSPFADEAQKAAKKDFFASQEPASNNSLVRNMNDMAPKADPMENSVAVSGNFPPPPASISTPRLPKAPKLPTLSPTTSPKMASGGMGSAPQSGPASSGAVDSGFGSILNLPSQVSSMAGKLLPDVENLVSPKAPNSSPVSLDPELDQKYFPKQKISPIPETAYAPVAPGKYPMLGEDGKLTIPGFFDYTIGNDSARLTSENQALKDALFASGEDIGWDTPRDYLNNLEPAKRDLIIRRARRLLDSRQ